MRKAKTLRNYLLASGFTLVVQGLVVLNTDWIVVLTKGKWITAVGAFLHLVHRLCRWGWARTGAVAGKWLLAEGWTRINLIP